jgi:hypothetical protein
MDPKGDKMRGDNMSENEKALVPVQQKEVEFYGDELTAVKVENGRVYVSIRHMCESLAIDTQGQTQRIDRHSILSEGKGVCNLHTPGGEQPTVVLRVDLVPLWLSGIRTSVIKNPATREKLESYQREAAAVLWEAFQDGRLTADPTFDELLQHDTPEVQAYKMLQGMLQLARNQIIIRGQLENHENRLEAIEAQLAAPEHAVTQSQAMQISQAVRAVAMAQGNQSGRNEFGSVYGELYRKFEVTSYKLLPAAKFEEVMSWLTTWHQELTSDTPF